LKIEEKEEEEENWWRTIFEFNSLYIILHSDKFNFDVEAEIDSIKTCHSLLATSYLCSFFKKKFKL